VRTTLLPPVSTTNAELAAIEFIFAPVASPLKAAKVIVLGQLGRNEPVVVGEGIVVKAFPA
jgi:hypothetical protein